VLAEQDLGPRVASRRHEHAGTVDAADPQRRAGDRLEEDVGEAGEAELLGDRDLHGRHA
jgi:hypothetical protein